MKIGNATKYKRLILLRNRKSCLEASQYKANTSSYSVSCTVACLCIRQTSADQELLLIFP
jgi:hypothetical protein